MTALSARIPIAFVENDREFLRMLEAMFRPSGRFEIVGSYPAVESALAGITGLVTPPRLVLMDLTFPRGNGVDCTRRLKSVLPNLLVLVLTVVEDGQKLFGALQAGADGYLLKRTSPVEIVAAVEELLAGGAPLSPSMARKVLKCFRDLPPKTGAAVDLTPRERAVLEYLAQHGGTDKELAATLGISAETVGHHLKNIYAKLHVRSRTEAIVKYLGRG